MSAITLPSIPRTDFGKGAARRMRRSGHVPAVVYGRGTQLVHLAIPTHDLALALRQPRAVFTLTVNGASVLVKPRDVQRDPVKQTLEHVDLVVIDAAEAAQREEMAHAIEAAVHAAEEAGMDSAAAVMALEDAVAHGEDPAHAAEHAVADAEHQAQEYADEHRTRDQAEQAAPAAE